MLSVKDLSFGYGKKKMVLHHIDFELANGQIGVVLGPNGAGKSTLFKNLVGIEKPKNGTILADGMDLCRIPEKERARLVGYVPQQVTFGSLTVTESVLLGRLSRFGFRPAREDEEKTEKLLKELDLWDLRDCYADSLSGGEQQKVAIARALNAEPKLLIFDEPTGNLDLSNEQLILNLAVKLAEEKHISILLSLHDINEALTVGDTFFFLKEGKLLYAGDREGVTVDLLREVYGVELKEREIDGKKYFFRI